MTLDRTTTDPRQLTAAAFKVTREYLGLTTAWIADRMGVRERTVHRWEAGVSPVPEGVRIELDVMAMDTAAAVAQLVTTARPHGAATVEQAPVLLTYRTDADYRRAQPPSTWPASWHRAVTARAAEQVPGAVITYWEPAE